MTKTVRNSGFIFFGIVMGFIVGYWLVKKRQPEYVAVSQPEPPWVTPPAAPKQVEDDLTQIDGIGPAYARALHALGVTTFNALAASDPDELAAKIDRLAAARIRRDDWLGQAAALGA